MNVDASMVINGYWADQIEDVFSSYVCYTCPECIKSVEDETLHFGEELFLNANEFLDTIWEMSLTAFDKPREVQVVIDSNNNLFISFGTPGFVSFRNQEDELYGEEGNPRQPMKLPIKCWIHTHPFGTAYFSGTDWNTIRTWEMLMDSAIVLGDNQRMLWTKERGEHTVFYRNGSIIEDEEE